MSILFPLLFFLFPRYEYHFSSDAFGGNFGVYSGDIGGGLCVIFEGESYLFVLHFMAGLGRGEGSREAGGGGGEFRGGDHDILEAVVVEGATEVVHPIVSINRLSACLSILDNFLNSFHSTTIVTSFSMSIKRIAKYLLNFSFPFSNNINKVEQ